MVEPPFGTVVVSRRVLEIDMGGHRYRAVGTGRRGVPEIQSERGRRIALFRGDAPLMVDPRTDDEVLMVALLHASGLIDAVRNQEFSPRIAS